MYIKSSRFPQINTVYCNASENGLLPASLPCLFILSLSRLHALPKSVAIIDCPREFLSSVGLGKQWCASTEASHQSGTDGPLQRAGRPDIPRHRPWAKTLCEAVSPFYNQQIHISPLPNGCMTEIISGWHLSCYFSQLLVTLATAFSILQNFIS